MSKKKKKKFTCIIIKTLWYSKNISDKGFGESDAVCIELLTSTGGGSSIESSICLALSCIVGRGGGDGRFEGWSMV